MGPAAEVQTMPQNEKKRKKDTMESNK